MNSPLTACLGLCLGLSSAAALAAQEHAHHAHAGHSEEEHLLHTIMHPHEQHAQEGQAAAAQLQAIMAAVSGNWRSEANRARDEFRHPVQTLTFFGINPQDTVIEITPGGGWYSEILAPLLRADGHYIAAVVNPDTLPAGGGRDYQQRARDNLNTLFASAPAQYDRAQVIAYDPAAPVLGAPASADLVLTFRNVHNWLTYSEATALGVLRSMYKSLKPGGYLGLVEHRLPAHRPWDEAAMQSGYVPEDYVIRLAERVGFKLVARSEINANPRDSADHTGGVWALPPSYRNGEIDRARYAAIGESDRMTLKFVKP